MKQRLQFTPASVFSGSRGEPCLQARRLRRPYRSVLWLSALILIVGLRLGAALGQDSPTGSPTGTVSTQEVTKLVNDLDDIDYMRNLNPLKLTAGQLDRVITAVSSEQDAFNKKLTDLAAARVQKMSDEIHEVKQKMLAGGQIPADFDDRVQKASVDFISKRDQLRLQSIASLSDKLKDIITTEQYLVIVKLTKEAPANASKYGKAKDEQWYHLYVANVILASERIVPLLKEMRTAKGNN